MLAALVLIALVTWWREPFDRLHGRFENVFAFEGTVGIGYAVLALGLAVAVGAVWRKTVPALVVAYAGYVAMRVFVDGWLRERFATLLTSTWPAAEPMPAEAREGLDPRLAPERSARQSRRRIEPVAGCDPGAKPIGDGVQLLDPSCLPADLYNHAVYHPASRFWLFQGIETALFAGVGVALIAFAAWWIHERTA